MRSQGTEAPEKATIDSTGNPNELVYFQEQPPTQGPPKRVTWGVTGNWADAFKDEDYISSQARRLILWLHAEGNNDLKLDLVEAICRRAIELIGRMHSLNEAENQLLIR